LADETDSGVATLWERLGQAEVGTSGLSANVRSCAGVGTPRPESKDMID
jgi:hypothetical protein